jgi:subtilisin family serine protease
LGNAVAAASAAGSLIVASAGNGGSDFPVFPAAFPNVMAVASVGMDGALATYSNAGTFISVAAPGGDFRLDDNGGGGVVGPGWNFATGKPTFLFGYGTSASAPFVSGIAALLLAQTPGLTAAQLRSRIEQFATRPAGFTRSDVLGWGIVNAYNALTQQNGPARQAFVRLVDATTGAAVKSAKVGTDGSFALTRLASGSYFVQAGDDEAGDALIGVSGRRFAWAGGFGKPTVFNVNSNSQAVGIALGIPAEVEPNDDIAHANVLSVGSYVTGAITTPDVRDVYSVAIPIAGTYTFETSGLVGSCGLGIELDTFLTLSSAAGTNIGSNNDFVSATGRFCSRIQATLTPGIFYISVTGTGSSGLASHGRYRLEVRSGS